MTSRWRGVSLPHPGMAFSIASPRQANLAGGLSKMETSNGEGELELVMEWIPTKLRQAVVPVGIGGQLP